MQGEIENRAMHTQLKLNASNTSEGSPDLFRCLEEAQETVVSALGPVTNSEISKPCQEFSPTLPSQGVVHQHIRWVVGVF
jgi:hypothetical protein